MLAGQVMLAHAPLLTQHTSGRKTSENPLTDPTSPVALSLTLRVQVPLAFWPSKADSGLNGANVPV
jgi:hypothetical protein